MIERMRWPFFAVVVLLVATTAVVSQSRDEKQNPTSQSSFDVDERIVRASIWSLKKDNVVYDKFVLDLAIKKWNWWLRHNTSEKTTREDLDRLMKDYTIMSGDFTHGGSGNYTMFYAIDDVLQIHADFTPDGKPRGPIEVDFRRPWLRLPDHSVLMADRD